MSKLEQIRALREGRVARKNSRGGVESRNARVIEGMPRGSKGGDLSSATAQKPIRRALSPHTARSDQQQAVPAAGIDRPQASVATGPRETKPKKPKRAKKRAKKPAPAVSKVKVGRPRAEDRGKTLSDTKPWVAAKMSRASWYRLKKAKAK